MALDASSRRWKLMKANPCSEQNEKQLLQQVIVIVVCPWIIVQEYSQRKVIPLPICGELLMLYICNVTNLGLSGVLVFGQVDPGDGAKWSEEFLQVSLTGVLRQVGHTNSSIVISCGPRRKQHVHTLEQQHGCHGATK